MDSLIEEVRVVLREGCHSKEDILQLKMKQESDLSFGEHILLIFHDRLESELLQRISLRDQEERDNKDREIKQLREVGLI